MLNNHKNNYILLILLIVLIWSCQKDPDKIGINLQPDKDKLEVFFNDTSTLIAYSIREDSIRTTETVVSMLGSYHDSVFGTTTSSIYTRFHLSSVSADFGESPQLDSMILILEYTGAWYGDTNTYQTFRVFELDEALDDDSSYYSTSTVSRGQQIASIGIRPAPHDSIHLGSITSYPQTRFKLSEEFGNKILNATADELSSDTSFVKLIKGINITADPVLSGGAIVSYNLISALSSAQIYYSNSKNDSLIYTFVINSACPRFMNFSHYNYVNASQSFRDQVVSGDTNLGSNRLYAQAMAGVKTKISFPHLKNLVQGNSIAINEAKLIISNATPNSVNAPPTEMSLIRIREDGGLDFLVDQFEGAEYFGGYYDYANNEYFFRITRHVQSIISKDTVDYGLYLVVTGASIIPNRLVIDGYNPTSSAEENRLKLDLFYTVLKN